MQSDCEYDVFISFKNTDTNTGEFTLDREIADKVYRYLTDRRLNVFFSPETLKALGRDSWSDEIDCALIKSKVFIAIGTQKDYMNAHRVKEERDKFFGLRLNDKSRAIYGYIASPMELEKLPDDMKGIEVFEDKKLDALKNLHIYINNHLNNIEKIEPKKLTRFETLFDYISIMVIPFSIIFIVLTSLSFFIFPSLELKDIVYAFLVISFLLSKIFLFFKGKS